MPRTVGYVETQVREKIRDSEDPFRWSAPTVLRFIWDSVVRLHSDRPESRYVNLRLAGIEEHDIDDDSDVEALRSEELPLEDRWTTALVHFVCHCCLAMDDSDTENQRLSSVHLESYRYWSQR